jgi:hypothetical protein
MARAKKMVSELLKAGFVSIDSYEDSCFAGRVFYPAFETEVKFKNAMQMIDAIGNSVNDLGYTDEYCKMRSFGALGEGGSAGEKTAALARIPKGKLATFKIKIIFMQNATWQGTIVWEESGEEQNFRSVLEMLNLMDSALKSGKS